MSALPVSSNLAKGKIFISTREKHLPLHSVVKVLNCEMQRKKIARNHLQYLVCGQKNMRLLDILFKFMGPVISLVFLLLAGYYDAQAQTNTTTSPTVKQSAKSTKSKTVQKNSQSKPSKSKNSSTKTKATASKSNPDTNSNFVGIDVIKAPKSNLKQTSPAPNTNPSASPAPVTSGSTNTANPAQGEGTVAAPATEDPTHPTPTSLTTAHPPVSRTKPTSTSNIDATNVDTVDKEASDSDEDKSATDDNYYNEETEDVLNPFSIESVKRHIHKLTAPEHAKSKHDKKHAENKAKKKPAPPKDPSKTPFTPEWNDQHGRRVLALIGIMLLALFAAPPVTRKLVKFMTQGREGSELTKRIGTSTQLGSKLIVVLILLLGLLEVLREFQIDVGPMLAGAGIFGVALGFAGQNLLKDYLAGTLMIIEEQIRVGDFVKLAGISGTVEEISLRKIQLRDFNGNVLYVPNSKVDVVVNMTREYSRYVIDVPVAYKENFNDVVKVLSDIDEEIRNTDEFNKVITEPLTIFGLSHFGTNGYVITVRTTTKPGDQWRVAREYRKLIKERFDKLGIEIPVSQLTIHTGVDKQGHAQPISIEKFKEGSSG